MTKRAIEVTDLERSIITEALKRMIGTFDQGWFDQEMKEAKSKGDEDRAERLADCKSAAISLRSRLREGGAA